jgi:hypothetical protein
MEAHDWVEWQMLCDILEDQGHSSESYVNGEQEVLDNTATRSWSGSRSRSWSWSRSRSGSWSGSRSRSGSGSTI